MIRIVDVNGQLKVTTNQQFRDNTFAILGSADQTKRLRFEVDGLTTATTRTATMLDSSGTVPYYEYAGTWTAAQNFQANGNHFFGINAATGNTSIALRGGNSGTGAGASLLTQANGTIIAGLGNYSSIIGGAFDATPITWFNGGMKWVEVATTRMHLDGSGNLCIGGTPTAGNGLLQFACGVTKANGVAAGSDTFFFRDGAGSWKIGGQNTNAYLQVDGANSGTNGGSFVVTRLNGVGTCGIGNWSALIGGGYDATPTLYGNGSIRIAPSGTIAQVVKYTGQTRFMPLSSDPAGAETGDVYYNSTTNKLRVYNGAWVDLH